MSRPIIGYIVDAATRLFTGRRIGGVLFDGTKDIDLPGVNQAGNQSTSGNAATATRLQTNRSFGITGDGNATAVNFNGTANVSLTLQLASITTSRTVGSNKKIPIITIDAKGRVTSINEVDVTGDSASATKLQTARKIGGVDFDGTKDINLPGVNTTGNQSTSGNAASATQLQTGRRINNSLFNGTVDVVTDIWGAARNITIGNLTRSVNGSGNVEWTLDAIGVGSVGRLSTNGSSTAFLRGDGQWATVNVDNTTYDEIPEAEVNAGTAAILRSITARRLKQAVDTHGLKLGATAATAKPGNWLPTWEDVTGKPVVIAAGTTQADARQAIGAGTSSLTLGTTAGTAAAGNDSRINNGQTAFGWGNHASAGYVKTNTTYSEITEAEVSAGTSATLRAVTGRRLKLAVDTHGLKVGTTAATAKAGNWVPSAGDIPNLDAGKIATGVLAAARIPNLGADKITSGVLEAARIPTLNQNTTGNAATATRLQTARTIGGVSFDGTGNINLPGVNTTGNQNTTGAAARLSGALPIPDNDLNNVTAPGFYYWTVGVANAPTSYGSMVVTSWSDVDGEAGEQLVMKNGTMWIRGKNDASSPWSAWQSPSDNVNSTTVHAMGTANATNATSGSLRSSGGLGVALDIFAGGNVTAYSDIRKKKDIVTIDNGLDIVLKSRGVYYTRKDTGVKEIGFIAQEMQKILPRVVGGNEDTGLGISYGNITAVLAEAIKDIYNKHILPTQELVETVRKENVNLKEDNIRLHDRLYRLEKLVDELSQKN